jgi:thioesterase domain-containing protein
MMTTTPDDVRDRGIREVNFDPLPSAPGGRPRSLIALKASGSTAPVFLVHGGYGQVFHFKRLAERVRDDIPMYALEARGVRDGQELVTSIEEMARNYVAEIRDLQPEGPYLLGGFSFGGWIAWEMAQQLDAAGEDVRLLLIDIGPGSDDRPQMSAIRKIGRIGSFHWRNWRGLTGRTRAAYRVDAFRNEVGRFSGALGLDPLGRLYGLAMKIGPKPTSDQAGLFRTSVAAMQDWDFVPFRQPVTLFRAQLQPPTGRLNHPKMGFTPELCPAGLDVRDIPGSHSFVFVEPHVNTLAVEFESWVDRQQQRDSATVAGGSMVADD